MSKSAINVSIHFTLHHYVVNVCYPTGAEISFSIPASTLVIESGNVDGRICVELTSIPSGGLECDIDVVLEPQAGTAGLHPYLCYANLYLIFNYVLCK